MNFLFLVVSTLGAFFCNFVAFCSGHWIESMPEYNSQFVRLGLWEACFNNYIHPEDYVSKAYQGCWWIYYPEFWYIRTWLIQPWFWAVQMMSIVVFLLMGFAAISIACMTLGCSHREAIKPRRWLLVCHGLSVILISIILIIMSVASKDRQWMPRPDQNRLSWSFGFQVMAGFMSVAGFLLVSTRFVAAYNDSIKASMRDPDAKSKLSEASGIHHAPTSFTFDPRGPQASTYTDTTV